MPKLLTRRAALAGGSALICAPFVGSASALEQVGMQLILAADVSGSVNPERYRIQQDGYLEALGDPRLLDVIGGLDPPVLGITFIAWSREQQVMVPWSRVSDAKSMDAFRDMLHARDRPQIGINTFISRALVFCSR